VPARPRRGADLARAEPLVVARRGQQRLEREGRPARQDEQRDDRRGDARPPPHERDPGEADSDQRVGHGIGEVRDLVDQRRQPRTVELGEAHERRGVARAGERNEVGQDARERQAGESGQRGEKRSAGRAQHAALRCYPPG